MREIPVKPSKRPHCYICGAIENLTDDHIPPQSFFPPDDRKDLLTADCCESCHRKLSDEDLVMRYWFSCALRASEAGQWIYWNRAIQSIAERPALFKNVVKATIVSDRSDLPPLTMENHMPSTRILPYFRRLTKALLYSFYPDYDYFSDEFAVFEIDYSKWKKLLPDLIYEKRGNGVFEVWHQLLPDENGTINGLWLFRIYESSPFVVYHSSKPEFVTVYPEGVEEHHKLPKFL